MERNAAERETETAGDGPALLHEEAPGITRVDLRWRGEPGLIAAWLVRDGGEAALVETGPASTTGALLAGLRAAGVAPEAVTRVLLTHVHLDHAGAAGGLLRRLPRARVSVHPAGARHLVDPSRLLASARRVFGGEMEAMWGETLPVAADRVDPAPEGAELRVGRRRLRAVETPGHAVHHLAFHEPDAEVVFTGDVAGVRLGLEPYVRPPTPPPDLDPEAWRESLRRLAALRPRRLLLTHFGGFGDAERHLADLAARLDAWLALARGRAAAGDGAAALAEALLAQDAAEIRAAGGDPERYERAVSSAMSAAGLLRRIREADGVASGARGGSVAADSTRRRGG